MGAGARKTTHDGQARPRLVVVPVVALLAALLPGCRAPGPGAPVPPGGGHEYVLDYEAYVTDVAPVLAARGCDTVACHGGGIRGTYALSPADDKDFPFDFAQARLQVLPADPATSPLLQKPLDPAAGGAAHAADLQQSGFPATSDPGYQTILAWIEAGEYR